MALVQPYLIYCIPLWGSQHKSEEFNDLFVLQKKCIRIVSNKTDKVGYAFQHTKPLFFQNNTLTVFNLYYYMTAMESMKIINTCIPISLYNKFKISKISNRCIVPKFSLSKIMNKSFIFNSSKILNYFIQHDIKYNELSIDVFKKRLKRHLIFTQTLSVRREGSWLPCNHDLFSDIVST